MSEITLTTEQEKVYDGVLDFFDSGEAGCRVLSGYAGTGKTTLVSKVIGSLLGGGNVAVVAYTGRAASILRHKGVEANTIHSTIYYPIFHGKRVIGYGKKIDHPDKCEEVMAIDYIIVDESSMIDIKLFNDLAELGKPILFVGDDAQLAPINDYESKHYFSVFSQRIDWQLYKIHRQALENPIIVLSKVIREGGKFEKELADGKHVTFLDRRSVMSTEHLKTVKYNMILSPVHRVRLKLIEKFRMIKGFDKLDYAAIGEPVMCRRNKLLNGNQVYNGELFNVFDITKGQEEDVELENDYIRTRVDNYILTPLDYESDKKYKISIPITSWDENEPYNKSMGYFIFGYATTVHRAQGSEFENVAYVREDVSYFKNSRHDSQKRMDYTAITRSINKLTVYL